MLRWHLCPDNILCGLNFHFSTTLRIHFLSLLEEWGEGKWDIRLQENLKKKIKKKWHAYCKRLEASHYKKLQAPAIIHLKFFTNLSIGVIPHPQTLISSFFNFPFFCWHSRLVLWHAVT
jgi:hypothetical protein